MIKLFIAIVFWSFLSWVALRVLNRLGKFTRPRDPKSIRTPPKDPIDQAKKADIIDIE